MVKVLIVGQTPPPYGGQAIMIQNLLDAPFERVGLYHVRMAFSREMKDIGKFKLSKMFHLLKVVSSIVYTRFRYHISVLYYPPGGPDKISLYRDLFILISTRWLFSKTIFHFHAAGVSNLYPELSPVMQYFFRKAIFYPDVVIRLSKDNPPDGLNLKARSEFIVPNGIQDHFVFSGERKVNSVPEILFVGLLCESKGVLVLIETANLLRNRGCNFRLKLMGDFESDKFRKTVVEYIQRYRLEEYITFLGILLGNEKWKCYSESDILCLPSYFESFGLVLIEAMQYTLPIVASRCGGTSSVVYDGKNGYLVPAGDSQTLADKLELLITHPNQARQMGSWGRKFFLQNYTLDKFYQNMESVFLSIMDQK
ncbi:MAG: glycosyltransferase [Anaerolineales bacterium]|nr:glycosyltransferase [Anaerolineales bacterium]